MALSDSQRKILEAIERLPSRGNSSAEIAAEVGENAVTVGRDLRLMETSLNPRPVQAEVDEGRGGAVWFLNPAAEDYLGETGD